MRGWGGITSPHVLSCRPEHQNKNELALVAANTCFEEGCDGNTPRRARAPVKKSLCRLVIMRTTVWSMRNCCMTLYQPKHGFVRKLTICNPSRIVKGTDVDKASVEALESVPATPLYLGVDLHGALLSNRETFSYVTYTKTSIVDVRTHVVNCIEQETSATTLRE